MCTIYLVMCSVCVCIYIDICALYIKRDFFIPIKTYFYPMGAILLSSKVPGLDYGI